MIQLKVIMENSDYFYTGFNGTATEAERYYTGKIFNVGTVNDDMQRCITVEIMEE